MWLHFDTKRSQSVQGVNSYDILFAGMSNLWKRYLFANPVTFSIHYIPVVGMLVATSGGWPPSTQTMIILLDIFYNYM